MRYGATSPFPTRAGFTIAAKAGEISGRGEIGNSGTDDALGSHEVRLKPDEMRLDWCRIGSELPLPLRERVGVRGYGLRRQRSRLDADIDLAFL